MKRLFLAIAFALIPLFAFAFQATVIEVVDGDTITVKDINDVKTIVRLYGVDAPKKKPYQLEGKKFLTNFIGGKIVEIRPIKTDMSGQIVGKVYMSDKTYVNGKMVREGLAWWNESITPNDAELKSLENIAKSERIGLWTGINYTPHWTWRKLEDPEEFTKSASNK